MSERFKLSLGGMWLLVSGVALVLPIFLPSANNGGLTGDVIGTATGTMFILSFPSSLFGLSLIFFVDATVGVNPQSIQGMYVNLLVMFILGLLQWFWIVPRIWRSEPEMQTLNLQASTSSPVLTEARLDEFFDVSDTTPLERVLRDQD